MFYVGHSYVDVRFDNTLIYSTSAAKSNRIGASPTSYWVVIPLSRLDNDKAVTVTVTPVFKSVENRKISFMLGSRYALFMKQLKADLPQLILSALCMVMGVLLIVVQLYLILRKRTAVWNIFFLGNFSLLLGIWRITDTRFSALMFKNYTMPVGYITLAALFTLAAPYCCIPISNTRKRAILCLILPQLQALSSVPSRLFASSFQLLSCAEFLLSAI